MCLQRPIKLVWLSALISVISLQAIATPSTATLFGKVDEASMATWRAFRAAQPFQAQLIALSDASKAQARTLIVSEPPPGTSANDLVKNLQPINKACAVARWSLMSGGWVTDVVCTVKDSTQPSTEQMQALKRQIYGTDEGPALVALPVPARSMHAERLDFRYSPDDLYRWTHEGEKRYRAGPLAPSVSLSAILDGKARGVFQGDAKKLVLWAIPRQTAIDGTSADFRKFAVVSDLILGALASQSTVVVVGRVRSMPLSQLPPLRSETMLLLAGSNQSELAQSYERNDLLGGKGMDGVDRAPILLSPQLVDTEFGNLLNIADQLLKGWSMAGAVTYLDFRYPKPKTYPFGSRPVVMVGKRTEGSFLFNWNTDGAAYRQSIHGIDVTVPQRTGALPIIYGDPKDRPRDLEERAYDYYAASGDTTLIRVAQYTLLFQIFRQFNIRAAAPPVSPRYAAFSQAMKTTTLQELKLIVGGMSRDELKARVREYWKASLATVKDSEFRKGDTTRQEVIDDQTEESMAVADELREGQQQSGGRLSNALVEIITYQRIRRPATQQEKQFLDQQIEVVQANLPIGPLLLDHNSAMLRDSQLMLVAGQAIGAWNVLASVDDQSRQAWNRTAYVVQSTANGPVTGGVGGHNIDAPMIRFVESKSQPAGQIAVTRDTNGELVVTHSANDTSRLGDIARQVGTRKAFDNAQIDAEVNTAMKNMTGHVPVRIDDLHPAAKVAAKEFRLLTDSDLAYRIRPVSTAEHAQLSELDKTGVQAVVFQQHSDGSFTLMRVGAPDAIQVASFRGATDALANGLLRTAGGQEPVTVLLQGVPDEKAEAMLGAIQASLRRYPDETVKHILSAESDAASLAERPALMSEKFSMNGVHIRKEEIKVETVQTGAFAGYTRVEVPITVVEQTPWHIRLIFFFKSLTSKTLDTLQAKIEKVFLTFTGPVSLSDVDLAIRQQLASDMNELALHAFVVRAENKVTPKVHDIVIGDVVGGHANEG
ncbi:hypothetical protein LJR029_006383 [Caballeronia sp. LjRoot29]|uniref:hypothetical protein n=1 Tax=Caballeronia sp. LjRoot29 TaxID=3342315 RepID=UPI003ED039BF